MAWREVAGLADADLKRYEEHRRMIRIVTAAELREPIVRELWESVLPAALAGSRSQIEEQTPLRMGHFSGESREKWSRML